MKKYSSQDTKISMPETVKKNFTVLSKNRDCKTILENHFLMDVYEMLHEPYKLKIFISNKLYKEKSCQKKI